MQSAVAQLRFGDHEEEILSRALENERLMELKVPNLKKAENARMSLSIEFACKSLNIAVSRAALIKLCGDLSPKIYVEAFQKCTNLMGLKFENHNTIDVFAIKYGSSQATVDAAHSILESYKQHQSASHMYNQVPDYSSALYQGAAFAVAAKASKLKSMPKKDAFFDSLDISNKQLFHKVCTDMEVSRKNVSSCVCVDHKQLLLLLLLILISRVVPSMRTC